jgi:hypothetical protein
MGYYSGYRLPCESRDPVGVYIVAMMPCQKKTRLGPCFRRGDAIRYKKLPIIFNTLNIFSEYPLINYG